MYIYPFGIQKGKGVFGRDVSKAVEAARAAKLRLFGRFFGFFTGHVKARRRDGNGIAKRAFGWRLHLQRNRPEIVFRPRCEIFDRSAHLSRTFGAGFYRFRFGVVAEFFAGALVEGIIGLGTMSIDGGVQRHLLGRKQRCSFRGHGRRFGGGRGCQDRRQQRGRGQRYGQLANSSSP